jgi:hypothetical protein
VLKTHPHITVGQHNRYGVVAATSHDNHVAEHILRLVGFERLPGSHLYGLSDPTREPLRRGAQAVQSLRAAQYSVTSDAAYDLQPYSQMDPNEGLSNRQEKPSAMPVADVGEAPFTSAHALDTFSYVRDIGRPDPTSARQQRRAQAATAVSPARTDVSPPRCPAASVEYRPAAAAPEPSRTR